MINTNTLHNVLNVVIALLSAATAFLVATGCVTAASGALDCTQSWVNPAYTTGVIAVLSGVKILVNVLRDGFGGLTKPQPPVDK